jgi:RNA recognition motif-containing protein
MKKVVTSSPTVTLMVSRIPSTITEEGVNNLFLECGTVLNLRLIVNKGGFAGIRGLNYAYVTLASSDEATLAIEKLNMQPPLNLGVALKPSEEERLKTREQDLLNRAFGSVNQEKVVVNRKESADESGSGFVAEKVNLEELVVQKEEDGITAEMLITNNEADAKVDEVVFMFNSPLVVTMMNKLAACCCGNEATLVCSRCKVASYCSQACQVAQWAGHRGECAGGPLGAGVGVNGKKEGEQVKKRKVARKPATEKQDSDNQESSLARSTENSPIADTLSSGPSSLDKMEFQDNSDRNQEITDEQSVVVKQETLLHLGANEKSSSDGKPTTDQDLGSGQDDKQANLGIKRSNARMSSSEDTCGQPPALEMLDEQTVVENTEVPENVPNFERSKDYLLQKNVQPVDQVEPVDDQSDISDDSGDSAPHFHSFLKFKEQIVVKEVMCSKIVNFEDALADDKAVGITIDQDIEQNVADNLLEPPTVIPAAGQPPTTLPSFTLPTTWTRAMTSVPVVDSDLFIVKTQGVEK